MSAPRAAARRGVALAGLLVACAAGGAARAQDVAASAPAGPGAVTIVDAAPAGPSVASRLEEIRRRIERNLVYPPIARHRDVSGAAVVEFEVLADGRTRSVRLARSSGAPLLDRAAERAVATASELPWVHGVLSIPIRFELVGPP